MGLAKLAPLLLHSSLTSVFGEQNVHQGSSEIIRIIRDHQALCTASMHHMDECGFDTKSNAMLMACMMWRAG